VLPDASGTEAPRVAAGVRRCPLQDRWGQYGFLWAFSQAHCKHLEWLAAHPA